MNGQLDMNDRSSVLRELRNIEKQKHVEGATWDTGTRDAWFAARDALERQLRQIERGNK